ncbi:hypothetical protein AMK59_4634 [Oryctes borbonicus]|uniref:Uncharacterized protein n=1 Tax=Oryctes borbonicus TaxID=1629725 RepID=A0A0T6B883_9SCAR|nr:hypothetical protein AMK59_4634 [Oryctes borbonicus]
MDESKKINAGKYRNKQRYKNKAKVVQKNEDQQSVENKDDKVKVDDNNLFQKRNLESNWYRYEPKEVDDSNSFRDFSVLASAPIQQASYFQFKSDKNIVDTEDIKQIDNKLFHLDVNLLHLSIVTIPFHIRCGIDDKYFSENQLEYIRKEAEESIINYNKYIKDRKEKVPSKHDQNKVPKKPLPDVEFTKTTHPNIASSESNELEQWLDDVLDN